MGGHSPGGHLRGWGTVRLRMTLWNVAVLALILGVMGAVVRYQVQADRFAAVDRTLAERAHEAGRLYALGPPYAGRRTGRPRVLDPMVVAAEGSLTRRGSMRASSLDSGRSFIVKLWNNRS